MGKRILVVSLLLLLATAAFGQSSGKTDKPDGFAYRHQAGIRLGVWSNLGDLPLASDTSGLSRYEADIKDASFYFEAYFAYRFNPVLMGELSLGIVNRGDVTVEETLNGITDRYYGNLTVYPIQARLKVYPLASTRSKFYPYVIGGVGIYHGRQDVQLTTDYWGFFEEPSRTSVSYTVGGGIDYPVAQQVGLDLAVTYMPVNFSKQLLNIEDYQALTITIGVKYLFNSTSK